MKCPPPAFDMDSIRRIETACRQRIEREPDDTNSRLRLAWCLVVLALHESGQEAILDRMANAASTEELQKTSPNSARQLLQGCLRQAMMVIDLSINPDEQKEAESLRALVRMSGGSDALTESNEESNQILVEIAQALMSKRDDDPPGARFYRSKDLLA